MCSYTELSGHPSRKEMGERTVNLLSITKTCHPSHLDHWCGFITALWQLCPHKKPGLSEQYQMERERQSSRWVTRNARFTQGLFRHEVVCCNIPSTLVKMTPLSQEQKIGKPRSFYGLNGQTVAVFPELAQAPLPGNSGVTLLEKLWERCHEHGHATVYASDWHHQALLDVNYLLTVVRDVSSSTNKINHMCMSRRDLTKLLWQISVLVRLTPWNWSGVKSPLTHEKTSLNKQK